MAEVRGKGKARVGKMDAIPTDSRLDTSTEDVCPDECECTRAKSSMGKERKARETAENNTYDSS